nr:putative ribonuclease H-like domain-containing protein [Tanacetum cinerariifolium]
SAFLYGTIDEEVYVMQPPGFQDPEFPEIVYKVEKAMYGLHQAPTAWPSPSIESNSNDLQSSNSSVSENEESSSSILSKPVITFVKAVDSTTAKNNYTHKSRSPRTVVHKTGRTPMRTNRPNMNVAQPTRTSFAKLTHSYIRRPCQRTSAVRTQFRVPRVSTLNTKFPTVNKKFPTGDSKLFTADLGNKGKAVKASACWILRHKQNITDKVVVAGTSSTNFSGTKDAASQEVKKDVPSLRYIVLPNWFHEAHLESSTSNAQDACNTDAPDSSENPNPTTTSTNPPKDQLETLTVESAIPTVSLPVPTACLDDYPEPSSDTRLISKRATSQDDTPSLDNILNLSNRFEDILGVTTNTNDTHGVEADLGNMENNISANLTPTFRIHKDHPKKFHCINPSQDKSRSPTILPILMLLVSEEPKKIFDSLKDPSWVEAMQEQLLQFKIQNVWILVDCLEGVRPIDTKWVLKNKKDERGIVIQNKARLVAQGHTKEEGIDYEEFFAPVARIKAIRLFLAYASFMGFTVYQMDVKSAFLYGTIDEEVYVMQPPRFQDPKFLARVYKVEKAMYGLH